MSGPVAFICGLQGLYFLVTGVWPLISMRTFLKVTGPKVDLWLVKTVGVLIAVVGAVLLLAAWRRAAVVEPAALAIGSALALAGVDVNYSMKGVISKIYLLDAIGEGIIVLAWAIALAWTQ